MEVAIWASSTRQILKPCILSRIRNNALIRCFDVEWFICETKHSYYLKCYLTYLQLLYQKLCDNNRDVWMSKKDVWMSSNFSNFLWLPGFYRQLENCIVKTGFSCLSCSAKTSTLILLKWVSFKVHPNILVLNLWSSSFFMVTTMLA